MKNSFIDSFVAFIVFMVVIFSLIKSVSIDDNLVETKFKVMDRVYVLPDSIPATIESTFIISAKQKVNGVRKRVIISENYTIFYADKIGTLHRFKYISPNHLIKKD
jgi:hypothetical protein